MRAKGAAFAPGLVPGLIIVCLAVLPGAPALARAPFSCAGMAVAGGAELLCSHTDPDAPAQTCTFSWTLMTTANQQSVISGSFVLPTGVMNSDVYQGSGFAYALSTPIVLCQGRKNG
jgi:hypothetical protein